MRTAVFTTAIILGTATAAFAQYSGPSDVGTGAGGDAFTSTTIQAILDTPKDGDYISVEGMLIRKVGEEMYLLSDGTSQINVEIDDDEFRGRDVSETMRVRIEGEVDTHLLRDVDIDAERLTVIE